MIHIRRWECELGAARKMGGMPSGDLKCYNIQRHCIHKHSSCTSASMHCNARPAAAVGVADNSNMSLQGDGVGEAFLELQD